METLRITPRTTPNKKIDTNHILKLITWKLNINISLIKITESRKPNHHRTFYFNYKFQNTFVKLFKIPHQFKPIHIITYKKKYYTLNEHPTIFPLLLLQNVNPQTHLTFKKKTVSTDHILQIIQRKKVDFSFPFTINIYTSYSALRKTSEEISRNMIGQLVSDITTDVFSVFLTPDIELSTGIKINALDTVKTSPKFNKHNLFANPHITEGDKIIDHRTPKEVTLNQEFCICDHKETQRFIPSRRRHRNLVSGQAHKFLLYENLGRYTLFSTFTFTPP